MASTFQTLQELDQIVEGQQLTESLEQNGQLDAILAEDANPANWSDAKTANELLKDLGI